MSENREQAVRQVVRSFLSARNRGWIQPDDKLQKMASDAQIENFLETRERWKRAGEERGIHYVSASSDCGVGVVNWLSDQFDDAEVEVYDSVRWLYRDQMDLQEEERTFLGTLRIQLQPHSDLLKVVDSYWSDEYLVLGGEPELLKVEPELSLTTTNWRVPYDRLKAFQYAELYWHEGNPAFKRFEVDCTNYASQVMHAGGFPMEWSKSRSKGWWYRQRGGRGDNWSYSWAVAHALKQFLERSAHTQKVADPRTLEVGDVICYDWDGNSRWQHNTVVTGFDGRGYPLVNAHTVDSRHRYWAYQDSYAYTENTQYSFFHITL
ncbi:MAG: hypothetical protein JWN30_261 [Bacilli bacterium]|nr:hypothetical protein [Bacilli bacterium]